jgi:predicted metal-dependent HD superfamily phosphohydrolase
MATHETFGEGRPARGASTFPWGRLEAVGIRTTADGPFAEDVFFQFVTPEGVFELPSSAVDSAWLTEMKERLAGFDFGKMIAAMGSTSEQVFRLWHKDESPFRWSAHALAERFSAIAARLGGRVHDANAMFGRLHDAWGAGDRAYHNVEHLTECLRELDRAPLEHEKRDIVELALFYHDAVYEPCGRDNEEQSARLLLDHSETLGLPVAVREVAAACVRATAHHPSWSAGPPASGATDRRHRAGSESLADWMVDIDRATLAKDPLRFLEYEYAVEKEYAAVPPRRFLLARGRFLAALLASPSIYRTAFFRERYEARARGNIDALLRSPRYRVHRWFGRFFGGVAGSRT